MNTDKFNYYIVSKLYKNSNLKFIKYNYDKYTLL